MVMLKQLLCTHLMYVDGFTGNVATLVILPSLLLIGEHLIGA